MSQKYEYKYIKVMSVKEVDQVYTIEAQDWTEVRYNTRASLDNIGVIYFEFDCKHSDYAYNTLSNLVLRQRSLDKFATIHDKAMNLTGISCSISEYYLAKPTEAPKKKSK